MTLAVRSIGYPKRSLPADVRKPWKAGQLFALTETARKFHACRARLKAMLGGLGFAKTTTLCAEAMFAGFENLGHVGVLFEPTIPLIRDVLRPSLEFRLEEFGLRRGEDWTFHATEWAWRVLGGAERGGFTILGRPATEWERIVGMNLAWAGLDEPSRMPQEALRQAILRVRTGPAQRTFLCGTQDPGTWVPRWSKDKSHGAVIFIAPSTENPYFSQASIDDLHRQFDVKALEAYLYGRSVSLTGNAAHAFVEDEWQRGNIRRCVYDPADGVYLTADNNRSPMCGSLWQASGNQVGCFSEITLAGGSWYSFGEAVYRSLERKRPKGIALFGDAVLRGGITNEATDWGHFADIRAGIERAFGDSVNVEMRCPKANPLEMDRLIGLNAMLCNAAGERRLVVDPSCTEVITDLREMETDENGRLRKPGRAGSRGVDPRRSHHFDAVGYMVMARWPPRSDVGHSAPELVTGKLSLG